MDSLRYTRENEISNVTFGRPHVVILGAGASRAALPAGDRHGFRLPLMDDLTELLDLRSLISEAGLDPADNFERTYAKLNESSRHADVVRRIDDVVDRYFSSLALPEEPTVYDALVLSLRPKDFIATFNWDPLLYQACARNHKLAQLPAVAYLHGNVAVGYCFRDRKKGLRGSRCSVCGEMFTSSRLLFPVHRKGYSADPYIGSEWRALKAALKGAYVLTIFGYGAPQSDAEAMELMSEAWGSPEARNLEQTEIIDIIDEEELSERWSRFIHTHHYDVHRTFWDSWAGVHPRRSCEAVWQQFMEANFISENRIPAARTFDELYGFLRPLLAVEERSARR